MYNVLKALTCKHENRTCVHGSEEVFYTPILSACLDCGKPFKDRPEGLCERTHPTYSYKSIPMEGDEE